MHGLDSSIGHLHIFSSPCNILMCARLSLTNLSDIYQSWWWFLSEGADPLCFISECLFCAKTVCLLRAPTGQKGKWAQLCLKDMSRQETVEQCLYHIHSILLPAAQKAKCFCTSSPFTGTDTITYDTTLFPRGFFGIVPQPPLLLS